MILGRILRGILLESGSRGAAGASPSAIFSGRCDFTPTGGAYPGNTYVLSQLHEATVADRVAPTRSGHDRGILGGAKFGWRDRGTEACRFRTRTPDGHAS